MNGKFSLSLITGGLFDVTDAEEEVAFRYAVDRVNADRTVLPDTRLTAQIERIPPHDSFYASKQGRYIYDIWSFGATDLPTTPMTRKKGKEGSPDDAEISFGFYFAFNGASLQKKAITAKLTNRLALIQFAYVYGTDALKKPL